MKNLKTKLLTSFSLLLLFVSLSSAQPNDALDLRAEPQYFSPNGDGIQDHTFFSPFLQSDKDVTRWRLEIRIPGRKKVRRITGAGFSALIKWDGKDKKGNIVEEGEYAGKVKVWGRDLRVTSSSQKVYVDVTPPLVELSVSTPVLDQNVIGQEVLEFSAVIMDDSPIDRWQLQVLDLLGRTVFVTWSTGTVQNVIWDGTDSTTGVLVPRGVYRTVLTVWDMAGNESAPAFLDVEVNATPREMLEKVLQIVIPVETDFGLLIQLAARDLFEFKKKKPVLKPEADEILREVALILNAYPDVEIKLNGYSHKLKKGRLNKNRSSLYAWSVYSHLVKKGNVKPSRMTVVGRGRSPLFRRRGLDLELVKNGVEIVLEGDREW